jgi:hypothetical protein
MTQATVVNCATGEVQTVTLPVPPLAVAKAAKWEQAKAERDRRIAAGCAVPGIGTFDSDDPSRSNITGAVTMALIAQAAGQPFSIGWKLADNTVATLDAAQMIGAGVVVGQYVAACHANAQALGQAIEAAGTIAALGDINIGAGWP